MKVSTREWVMKAEHDFAAATLLRRSRRKSFHATVCFHAQQCVEKYLKARLNEGNVMFYKTHNLEALLLDTLPLEPLWSAWQPAFKRLTSYAVESRYPGWLILSGDARQALKDCQAFRKDARLSLGLPAR